MKMAKLKACSLRNKIGSSPCEHALKLGNSCSKETFSKSFLE